jgi:hypothetical protein
MAAWVVLLQRDKRIDSLVEFSHFCSLSPIFLLTVGKTPARCCSRDGIVLGMGVAFIWV